MAATRNCRRSLDMDPTKKSNRSSSSSPRKPFQPVQTSKSTPDKRRVTRSQSTPGSTPDSTPCKLSPRKTPKRGTKRSPAEEINPKALKQQKTNENDEDDEEPNLSSRTFYGSSKGKYLTPLERKELKMNVENDENFVSMIEAAKAAQAKRNPARSKAKPVSKSPRGNSVKLRNLEKKQPLNSRVDQLKTEEKNSPVKTSPSKQSPSKQSPSKKTPNSGKKFFKNRSPRKNARKGSTSVLMKKGGFDLKFKPGALPKKTKKEEKSLMSTVSKSPSNRATFSPLRMSPRKNTPGKSDFKSLHPASPLAKVSTPPLRVSPRKKTTPLKNNFPSSPLAKAPESPLRHSPRKKSVLSKGDFQPLDLKPTDNSENKFSQDLFEDWDDSEIDDKDSGKGLSGSVKDYSPAKGVIVQRRAGSSSPDSVMLLSEFGSNASSPRQTPKTGKKLFPIFTAKKQTDSPRSSSSLRSGDSSTPSTPSSQSTLSSRKNSPALKNSPRNSPLLRGKRAKDDSTQMLIDAGQKRIGSIQCSGCGMIYSVGEPADETHHAKFHSRVLSALKFPGWKKERVVRQELDGSKIVMILPEDKYASKKVDQIKQIVDEELGFSVGAKVSTHTKTFLYVSDDQKVVGFCLTQMISEGYRVLSDSQSDESLLDRTRPWCCSTSPEPAKCGINRIWVASSDRRKGIASKLLDCARCNFVMGRPLSCEDLAFSDPTPDGKIFASNYTQTANFLVYKNA